MTVAAPEGYEAYKGDDGRFAGLVGPLFVDKQSASLPRFKFMPLERHANAGGAVHGGMLMTLADQVLGLSVVAAAGGSRVVTVSLTNEFVSMARVGAWISGEAEIVRQTRSLIFVRGDLVQDGTIVLAAVGIWKKIKTV